MASKLLYSNMWVRSYVYEPELNHNQVRSIPYTFPDFHRTVRFSPYCDRTDEGMNPWFMIRDGGLKETGHRLDLCITIYGTQEH